MLRDQVRLNAARDIAEALSLAVPQQPQGGAPGGPRPPAPPPAPGPLASTPAGPPMGAQRPEMSPLQALPTFKSPPMQAALQGAEGIKGHPNFSKPVGFARGGLVNEALSKMGLSAEKRLFLQMLAGRKRPITEKDFSDSELDNLRFAVENAKRRGSSAVGYEDYGNLDAVRKSLGRAKIDDDFIVDAYDFYNDERAPDVEMYEKMRPMKRAAAVLSGDGSYDPEIVGRIGSAYIGRRATPVRIKYKD